MVVLFFIVIINLDVREPENFFFPLSPSFLRIQERFVDFHYFMIFPLNYFQNHTNLFFRREVVLFCCGFKEQTIKTILYSLKCFYFYVSLKILILLFFFYLQNSKRVSCFLFFFYFQHLIILPQTTSILCSHLEIFESVPPEPRFDFVLLHASEVIFPLLHLSHLLVQQVWNILEPEKKKKLVKEKKEKGGRKGEEGRKPHRLLRICNS